MSNRVVFREVAKKTDLKIRGTRYQYEILVDDAIVYQSQNDSTFDLTFARGVEVGIHIALRLENKP
jgi:hypothetical protein